MSVALYCECYKSGAPKADENRKYKHWTIKPRCSESTLHQHYVYFQTKLSFVVWGKEFSRLLDGFTFRLAPKRVMLFSKSGVKVSFLMLMIRFYAKAFNKLPKASLLLGSHVPTSSSLATQSFSFLIWENISHQKVNQTISLKTRAVIIWNCQNKL